MTARSWAVVAFAVLLVALAVTVWALVPWQRPPAPRADQLAALADLPADQVARGKEFRSAMRPGSYGGLVAGLVAALVLGLTPLGARLVELAGRPFGDHWVAQAVLGGLAIVLVADLVTLPFAAWRHTVAGPLRPVHPGLGRLGGRPAQGVRRRRGDRRRGAARLLHGRPAGAALVVGARRGRRRRAGRAAHVRAAGAGRAGVQQVHPDGARPAAHRADGDGRSATACRCATCWSPTRRGAPARSTPTSPASGPTRRIVVYDTLLREAPPAEVTGVVAHELGHAKDRDVFASAR